MPEPLLPASFTLPQECAFAMADSLLEAARELFRRRRETPDLTQEERQALIEAETRLRQDADGYRTRAITWLGNETECELNALTEGMMAARDALKQVDTVRHCLKIAAALITFSTAIASGGSLPTIVKAGNSLQHTVKKA